MEDDWMPVGPGPGPIRPWTLRNRLAHHGFRAGWGWSTTYGTAHEGNRAILMKAPAGNACYGLPAWFVCILSATYPAIALVRGPLLRRRKRKKFGLCLKCGYDLRGSNGRCPECGTEFESSGAEELGSSMGEADA